MDASFVKIGVVEAITYLWCLKFLSLCSPFLV